TGLRAQLGPRRRLAKQLAGAGAPEFRVIQLTTGPEEAVEPGQCLPYTVGPVPGVGRPGRREAFDALAVVMEPAVPEEPERALDLKAQLAGPGSADQQVRRLRALGVAQRLQGLRPLPHVDAIVEYHGAERRHQPRARSRR